MVWLQGSHLLVLCTISGFSARCVHSTANAGKIRYVANDCSADVHKSTTNMALSSHMVSLNSICFQTTLPEGPYDGHVAYERDYWSSVESNG